MHAALPELPSLSPVNDEQQLTSVDQVYIAALVI